MLCVLICFHSSSWLRESDGLYDCRSPFVYAAFVAGSPSARIGSGMAGPLLPASPVRFCVVLRFSRRGDNSTEKKKHAAVNGTHHPRIRSSGAPGISTAVSGSRGS